MVNYLAPLGTCIRPLLKVTSAARQVALGRSVPSYVAHSGPKHLKTANCAGLTQLFRQMSIDTKSQLPKETGPILKQEKDSVVVHICRDDKQSFEEDSCAKATLIGCLALVSTLTVVKLINSLHA